MTRKPASRRPGDSARPAVTADRFVRLVRMLHYLAGAPRTRAIILRRLNMDLRAFYRDLTLLRSAGIHVRLLEGHYVLSEPIEKVLPRLPFPDPQMTLGEAQELAKGRSTAARRLARQIEKMVS